MTPQEEWLVTNGLVGAFERALVRDLIDNRVRHDPIYDEDGHIIGFTNEPDAIDGAIKATA